ncbi:hypothetical protein [Novilysobacter defluvii]|nr:hypothetical protein [Lysobacter defluvii]
MAEDEGLATLILNWQAMTPEQRAVLIAAADQVVRAGDTRPPP